MVTLALRNKPRMICAFVAGSLALLTAGQLSATSPGSFVTTAAKTLKGVDLDGRLRRLGEQDGSKFVVVVFIATECPISNRYLPALNRLSARYGRQGVEFYGVISDRGVSRKEATRHRDDFKIKFPILFDNAGELRDSLEATHTPQAFLLELSGVELYSGLIDDQFVKIGKKKKAAKRRFLNDAIESAIAGKEVAYNRTRPIGCRLEDQPHDFGKSDVTFARDVAPLIHTNCVSCHQPGQSAPFSLLTYNDVSRHALQIVEVTESRFMPPWKPEHGYGKFLDERRLSDREIELLKTWVKNGKPKGVREDLPPRPKRVSGWALGTPHKVLTMSEFFTIPAEGPDIRQYFVIPMKMHENRLITMVDFQPGSPKVVHHASFYIDRNREGRRLDAEDPKYGYQGFGGPGFEVGGTLRSWLPGMSPRKLPKGMGRLVERGSDLVLEIHYTASGKIEQDRSRIGLYFAPKSAKQLVQELLIGNRSIKIPAGAERHHERATYTLPVETILLDTAPHMHVLGQEIKAYAELPDGSKEPLVWIKDWDFNWQSQYSYSQPITLPKGTRIVLDAWFDNSKNNPLNPNSPPKDVYWGDDSTDEMLMCHFQCTCATMKKLEELTADYQRYFQDEARKHEQLMESLKTQ